MVIRKLNGGQYQVDFYLGSWRFRKNFDDESEARVLLAFLEKTCAIRAQSIEKATSQYLLTVSKNKTKTSQSNDNYILSRLLGFIKRTIYREKHPGGDEVPSHYVVFVDEIKPHHMETFRQELVAQGMANTSINRYFNTVKHFFRKCDEWGFISQIPTRHLRALPSFTKKRKIWAMSEVTEARRWLGDKETDLFDFIFFTGCRLSQATTLKIYQVNIDAKTLSLKSRKGPQSIEKIYDVPMIEALVERIKKIIAGRNPNENVFLDGNGKPFEALLFSRTFRRFLISKNFTDNRLGLHSLRHTFATKLSKHGVPLNDIRKLLGHSTTKVTEGYIHSTLDELHEHLKKIG